ncbi:MAG: DUF3500 domain-containing protein, partial [Gammaproteobacteria bacterium]|nr:DUF3500 domain-containing protein [Gammaproteobacteria bacterium]
MKIRILPVIVCLASMLIGISAQAQYPQNLLNQKRTFNQMGADAIGDPYVGLTTSDGLRTGLFPIRSTGVSTAPIVAAAEQFLATLDDVHLSR